VGLALATVGSQLPSSLQAADVMTFSALEDSGPQEVAKLVLREAYERIGITFQFRAMPGERALVESNAGRTDGEVARLKGIDKKYENLVRVPVAISQLEGIAFTKNPALTSNGWDSLKDYRIGAFTGSKFVERNTAGMKVDYQPGVKNLFSMLERGRLDVIVIPYLSGLRYIKKNSLSGFKALLPPLTTIRLYHYLNVKHRSILPGITEALKAMEKAGRIQMHRENFIAGLKN
jgi:hypothetical protein